MSWINLSFIWFRFNRTKHRLFVFASLLDNAFDQPDSKAYRVQVMLFHHIRIFSNTLEINKHVNIFQTRLLYIKVNMLREY